jgi:hypothetical protein
MALRSNYAAGQIKGARGILLDWKVELGCPRFDLAMAAAVTRVARFGSTRNLSGATPFIGIFSLLLVMDADSISMRIRF